jgi:hypothetical protein
LHHIFLDRLFENRQHVYSLSIILEYSDGKIYSVSHLERVVTKPRIPSCDTTSVTFPVSLCGYFSALIPKSFASGDAGVVSSLNAVRGKQNWYFKEGNSRTGN